MGKAKLDRSRSFGEIIGIVSDGVRYQQDGKDFDGQGNEIKNDAPVPGAVVQMTVQEVVRKFPAPGVTPPQPVKKKRRKRRTKEQMAAARAEKQAPSRPAVLTTEVFK